MSQVNRAQESKGRFGKDRGPRLFYGILHELAWISVWNLCMLRWIYLPWEDRYFTSATILTVGEKLPLTTFEDHELFMLVVVEIIIFMSSMKTEMTKDLPRACRGTLCERRYVVTEFKMLANIRRAGVAVNFDSPIKWLPQSLYTRIFWLPQSLDTSILWLPGVVSSWKIVTPLGIS